MSRSFFVWLWAPFNTAFLAFEAFALASALEQQGLASLPSAPSSSSQDLFICFFFFFNWRIIALQCCVDF